ncbi:MAG: M20/M25/M40 family metallo-hydrolase [Gammaproteobacteria bacterium]|nr:M20/M25/M40 family metallo-hydrolase [Gammaproteobacteria bacterium]
MRVLPRVLRVTVAVAAVAALGTLADPLLAQSRNAAALNAAAPNAAAPNAAAQTASTVAPPATASAEPAPPPPVLLSRDALAGAVGVRDVAQRSDEGYRLLEELTTEVGQRFAGTAGDKAGVEWAVRTLQSLGFTNVHTQEVVVPRWVRGEASFQVLAPYPMSMVTTALGGSIGTADEGLEAPIVMVQDIAALQALPEGTVRGKIVFFNGRTERTRDGSGYGKAVRSRTEGPSVAGALGAVGVVIRSIGTSKNRIAHTGTLSYNVSSPRIPAVAISNPDADLLERQLAATRPDGKAAGSQVTIRMRVTARDLPQVRSANVIGDIPGTDLANEIVLIGAHLDSWDTGQGVQDDGAGVAIAIAAARAAAAVNPKPRRTLRVVLFANEEFGLSGAARYPAAAGDESVQQHAFAMEADLGDGPVWKLSARVPDTYWAAVEQVQRVVKSLDVELGDNTAGGGADLGPLRRQGVPILAPQLDASTYFDVHHTVNDTLDQVDPAHLRQSTAVFAVAAYAAAMIDGPVPRLTADQAR